MRHQWIGLESEIGDFFFRCNCSVVPIDDEMKGIAREKGLERIKRR